jgi:transposase
MRPAATFWSEQPVDEADLGERPAATIVASSTRKKLVWCSLPRVDHLGREWLADLLPHGLLRGSFLPPAAIRELRDLTRYRKTLAQERSQEANRVQKLLEGADIKLAAVATNVLGVSGRQMLDAVIAGEEDPAALAEFARASLRKKLPQLRQALEGRVKPHHRLLLTQLLGHIDYLTTAIAEIEREVERCLAPFAEAVTLLQTIPGISAIAAAIIAEIGVDTGRFPV